MSKLERQAKYFSIEEANRTLPLVSRIVKDLVKATRSMDEIHEKARESVEQGRPDQAEELQERMQSVAYERQGYAAELEEIGCELKDQNLGLVDFPTWIDEGRVVLLCWKLEEAEIRHWHERDGGFSGRQSIEGRQFSGADPG